MGGDQAFQTARSQGTWELMLKRKLEVKGTENSRLHPTLVKEYGRKRKRAETGRTRPMADVRKRRHHFPDEKPKKRKKKKTNKTNKKKPKKKKNHHPKPQTQDNGKVAGKRSGRLIVLSYQDCERDCDLALVNSWGSFVGGQKKARRLSSFDYHGA